MKKSIAIKDVVAIGIGAALFVVIGMVKIPLFANTSVQLQYAFQALFSVVFGPLVGGLIGFIGHAINDMLSGYGVWWTWVISSGLFGLLLGLFRKQFALEEGKFDKKAALKLIGIQLAINLGIWGVIAPLGDVLFYSEPINKVFAQGAISGAANSLTVAIGGTLLFALYAKSRPQSNSLSKD